MWLWLVAHTASSISGDLNLNGQLWLEWRERVCVYQIKRTDSKHSSCRKCAIKWKLLFLSHFYNSRVAMHPVWLLLPLLLLLFLAMRLRYVLYNASSRKLHQMVMVETFNARQRRITKAKSIKVDANYFICLIASCCVLLWFLFLFSSSVDLDNWQHISQFAIIIELEGNIANISTTQQQKINNISMHWTR